MKRLFALVSKITTLSLILAACSGLGPGAAGLDATQAPAGTEPPIASEVPSEVPVDLVGAPVMKVGSYWNWPDGAVIAAVPGGPFKMGFNNFFDSREHDVTVSDFWIYTAEVSNQQYALCVAAGLCTPPDPTDNPGFDNYRYYGFPVVGVNYQQAVDYCTFTHGRLPTEAEWEKGARGEVSNPFPWGDAAPGCSLLNFNFCTKGPQNVKSYPDGASAYGLFDMSGNVKEWVGDWYKPDYFADAEALTDPLGPAQGQKRSVRSSSFSDSADFAFAAHRFSLNPIDHLPDLGFRCVVDDPTYFAPLCTTLSYIGVGPNGEGSDCVPDIKCNDVSITQEKKCHKVDDPYTDITFGVDDATIPWSFDPADCSALGNDKFRCEGPPDTGFGPVKAQGGSKDASSCQASCDGENYQLQDDGTCKWNGAASIGTECIAGTTYDPLLQCCMADPSSAVNYQMCPGGYDEVTGKCVSDNACDADSEKQTIVYAPCTAPDTDQLGDDEGNSCNLVCGGCQILDVKTCTCVSDPSC